MLALLLGAPGALAQPMFKSTMPDGKVVYGEKPVPGATKVDTIEAPPAKSGITPITPRERALSEQAAKDKAKPAPPTSPDRVAEARKQLQQAEAALAAGKEPLPGERTGIAGGGSRLNDSYFERLKSLEKAVADAKKRLADAQQTVR
jgi:hypothetical protein